MAVEKTLKRNNLGEEKELVAVKKISKKNRFKKLTEKTKLGEKEVIAENIRKRKKLKIWK